MFAVPPCKLRIGECDERGRKFSATTAFGITDTISGSRDARRTVFSLLNVVSVGQPSGIELHLIPCVANTNDVIDVTQCELQKFVRQYTSSVCEAEERMICKNSSKSHGSGMQNSFMA